MLFGGTVPPNCVLFGGTVPPNSFFLYLFHVICLILVNYKDGDYFSLELDGLGLDIHIIS
jgi:hypothetical protein